MEFVSHDDYASSETYDQARKLFVELREKLFNCTEAQAMWVNRVERVCKVTN